MFSSNFISLLRYSCSITSITISGCKYGDYYASGILDSLSHNNDCLIKCINFSDSINDGEKGHTSTALVTFLSFSSIFEELDLSHCIGLNIQMLSTSVAQCVTLRKLNLQFCKLVDNDIITLCESLQYNNTLREMYIGNNPYTYSALESIRNLLQTNHSIIELGNVDLMPEVLKPLTPSDVQTAKNLVEQIYHILNDVRIWLSNA